MWQPRADSELPTQFSLRRRVFCITAALRRLLPTLTLLQANSPTYDSESFKGGWKIKEALGPGLIFLISWLFSPNIFVYR